MARNEELVGRISLLFCWMTWQCCSWYVDANECNSTILQHHVRPTNLSLTTSEKKILLFWNCDAPIEILTDVTYEIHIKNIEETWDYLTEKKGCHQEISVKPLKKELPRICLKVIPVVHNKECKHLSSEICKDSERNGILVENVSCTVYNTSSMECTWAFGTSVPHNSMYNVSFVQEVDSQYSQQDCQQYELDLERRSGSCILHDLSLNYFESVSIIFEGSGSEKEEFHDWFIPAEQERFNPPRNITISCSGEDIIVNWTSPHTHNNGHRCFEYMIEKNKGQYISKITSYVLQHIENECLIKIRARGNPFCGININWGQWSKMKSCDMCKNNREKRLDAALMTVIVVSGFIIVLFTVLTWHYKRFINVCFPQIPQPKNYLDFTHDCKLNLEKNGHIVEFQPKLEIEEQITIPENIS